MEAAAKPAKEYTSEALLSSDVLPSITLSTGSFTTLGSSDSLADIIVPHALISPVQCSLRLELTTGALVLIDRSDHGTFVDGALVGCGKSTKLRKGSLITFVLPEPDTAFGDVPSLTVASLHSRALPPLKADERVSAGQFRVNPTYSKVHQ